MVTLLIRFVVGGVVVSMFALVAEVLGPKSLAGIFGAAPSVALATLGLTILNQGKSYAAQESRSMIGGAIAFCAYACCLVWLGKGKSSVPRVSVVSLVSWLAIALSFWAFVK
jgi:Protein of unknown function (DUF3147)